MGVEKRVRLSVGCASLSSSASRKRLFAPRAGAEGGGGGVRAAVLGGGVCLGETGRAALCDRGERRGVMGKGLWRR